LQNYVAIFNPAANLRMIGYAFSIDWETGYHRPCSRYLPCVYFLWARIESPIFLRKVHSTHLAKLLQILLFIMERGYEEKPRSVIPSQRWIVRNGREGISIFEKPLYIGAHSTVRDIGQVIRKSGAEAFQRLEI
jgi:ABC-type iron transport system FetAB permease component